MNVASNLAIRNQCRAQSAASISNIRWNNVADELETLLYATANGFKQSRTLNKKLLKLKSNTLSAA